MPSYKDADNKIHWLDDPVFANLLPLGSIEITEQEAADLRVIIAPEQVAAKEAARVESLWQAAHDYEYAQINGSAVGMLTAGVLQGLPKCVAVKGWLLSIWKIYYERKASGSYNIDYSSCGNMPYTIPELIDETNL